MNTYLALYSLNGFLILGAKDSLGGAGGPSIPKWTRLPSSNLSKINVVAFSSSTSLFILNTERPLPYCQLLDHPLVFGNRLRYELRMAAS